jgi:hypothetical protein
VAVRGHHAYGGEELEDHDLGLHVGVVETERDRFERSLLLHHYAETVLAMIELFFDCVRMKENINNSADNN